MNPYASWLLIVTVPAAVSAMDAPKIDLLGGAAFTDTWLDVSIGASDAEVRASDTDFTVYHLGVSGYSVSGYSTRPKRDAGGLLGVAVLARGWTANDKGVKYTAIAPFGVLVGGGYIKPTDRMRLSLTGELGPGLAFSHVDDDGDSRNKLFRPAFHAGIKATWMTALEGDADLGLILGYDRDVLPDVTISGPYLALALAWHEAPRAK